ncbi:MAG: hypothetical protein ACRDWY_15895 [Actinomycetes bacterium]
MTTNPSPFDDLDEDVCAMNAITRLLTSLDAAEIASIGEERGSPGTVAIFTALSDCIDALTDENRAALLRAVDGLSDEERHAVLEIVKRDIGEGRLLSATGRLLACTRVIDGDINALRAGRPVRVGCMTGTEGQVLATWVDEVYRPS